MKTKLTYINRRQFLATGAFALASLKFGGLGCAAQAKGKGVGYSDSHAHLDSFQSEELKKVLARMKEKNVSTVMNVSINLLTSAEAIKIAQANDGIYAAIGIHPGEAIPLTAEVKKKLEDLSGQKKVVAFGEVGLMYGNSTGSNEEQKQLLLFQKSLANNLHIPLDIHCSANAYKDCISICKGSSGIMHGFTGTTDDLNAWLDIGYYISIGMMSGVSEEVLRAIPADRIITETDSMARENSRWDQLGKSSGGPSGPPGGGQGGAPSSGPGGAPGGQQGGAPGGTSMQEEPTGPADVVKVAEKLAQIRGASTEEMGAVATNNLKRVLKI